MKNYYKIHPDCSTNYLHSHPEQQEKARKRAKNWVKNNPEKYEEQKEKLRNLRLEVIKLLGGQCVNLFGQHDKPYTDIRALQIDHVNGGGKQELKKYGKHRRQYYEYLIEKIKSGSKDYQLLCANCNWIKKAVKKEV